MNVYEKLLVAEFVCFAFGLVFWDIDRHGETWMGRAGLPLAAAAFFSVLGTLILYSWLG